MKVLLMDVNCKYSSTGKIVYDLYNQLNKVGHTAAIAYGRGPLVQETNIYRFSPKWEVCLHALLTRLTGYTGCFSYVATRRLLRYIDSFKPDVVHLNDMHGYFVNIIPLVKYLKKKSIKTVWTFHCEFMYTGKCGHAYECEKWLDNCGNCPYLKDYPQSFWFDKTTKMLQSKKEVMLEWAGLDIVVPSGWLADRVKKSFLKKQEVHVVFNGLNTDVFHKKSVEKLKNVLKLNNERIVLAVAPNLMSDSKGGKYVLELAKKMPHIKFIMIGAEANSIPAMANVIDIGIVQDAHILADYYSLADVFVLCSKRETFSMTTAEALCCGTPVVGFRAGAPEAIAIDEYSQFVEYGDVDALKEAVDIFLNKDMKSQSANIESKAKQVYADERMFLEYFRIYDARKELQ